MGRSRGHQEEDPEDRSRALDDPVPSHPDSFRLRTGIALGLERRLAVAEELLDEVEAAAIALRPSIGARPRSPPTPARFDLGKGKRRLGARGGRLDEGKQRLVDASVLLLRP